jgi:hypothetical protein
VTDPTSEEAVQIGRRSLDRIRTADFICFMDVLTVIVVVLTAYFKAGGWSELGLFPWNVVIVGVVALFFRMLLLSTLSGTMIKLIGGVLSNLNSIYNTFTTSVTDSEDQRMWPFANALKSDPPSWLRSTDASWYSLIVLGVFALIMIVAGSGGVADSPFRDILVATFILGQFRAPTAKGIWALFGFGILAAAATEVLYASLRHAHTFGLAHLSFPGSYYIAPSLLVGLVSTLVYYLTFINEAKRRLNRPDTQSGA